MMQTLKKYPLVFLFAAFLLIVSAANLLTPDREERTREPPARPEAEADGDGAAGEGPGEQVHPAV
jgi:hypothetical protein